MKLFLDLGNTRLKWQLYEDENTAASGAWAYEDVLQQAQLWREQPIEGVWLAAVGLSALADELVQLLESFGFSVHRIVSLAQQAGVTNAYEQPEKLGVDRWLGLLAARELGGNVLVVDAGTAMTIDALNADGLHLGGLILPGLNMMRDSLHSNTDLLPVAEGSEWSLGKNTAQAIAGGTLGALVSTVESVLAELQAGGRAWRCVVTGGDGELVYNALRSDMRQYAQLERDWMFKGLHMAASQS